MADSLLKRSIAGEMCLMASQRGRSAGEPGKIILCVRAWASVPCRYYGCRADTTHLQSSTGSIISDASLDMLAGCSLARQAQTVEHC